MISYNLKIITYNLKVINDKKGWIVWASLMVSYKTSGKSYYYSNSSTILVITILILVNTTITDTKVLIVYQLKRKLN